MLCLSRFRNINQILQDFLQNITQYFTFKEKYVLKMASAMPIPHSLGKIALDTRRHSRDEKATRKVSVQVILCTGAGALRENVCTEQDNSLTAR